MSIPHFREPDVGVTCEDCLEVNYYYSTDEAQFNGWVDSPLGWICKDCWKARELKGQLQ